VDRPYRPRPGPTRPESRGDMRSASWCCPPFLELHEVIARVDGEDEVFEGPARRMERRDLVGDGGRRNLLEGVDDVGLAERPVPHASDAACFDLRVGLHV